MCANAAVGQCLALCSIVALTTGGSIAGSLGGSMGGSMLVGSLLGPVGALAGAIGGAIAGSRAGAVGVLGICDVVDSTSSQVCPECQAAASTRPTGHQNWGGGRPLVPASMRQRLPQGSKQEVQQISQGDVISESAAVAGAEFERRSGSKVGEGLSNVQAAGSRSRYRRNHPEVLPPQNLPLPAQGRVLGPLRAAAGRWAAQKMLRERMRQGRSE